MKKPNQRRKSDITVRGFVLFEEGPVPVEDLTPDQRERWEASMRARLTEAMNDYYSQHPEEYMRLSD